MSRPTAERINTILATSTVIFAVAGLAFLGYALSRNPQLFSRRPETHRELNPYILQVVEEYAKNAQDIKPIPGKDPEFNGAGVTKDIYYRGQRVIKGTTGQRCHCIGLVFEIFMTAWERAARASGRELIVGDGSIETFRKFQKRFYGAEGDIATMVSGLTEYGLGIPITDWDKVKPGDFVQLWRICCGGHASIFIDWLRDPKGKITGFRLFQCGYESKLGYVDVDFQSYSVDTRAVFFVRPILP